MQIEEMEAKFQHAIRAHYPGVIVRENTRIPDYDIFPFFDVFMVPDERNHEFLFKFLGEDWQDFIKKENLPDADLIPHGVSVTREHYPHIWREAQKELAARPTSAKAKSGVAASRARKSVKSKPAAPRRSLAPKS